MPSPTDARTPPAARRMSFAAKPAALRDDPNDGGQSLRARPIVHRAAFPALAATGQPR